MAAVSQLFHTSIGYKINSECDKALGLNVNETLWHLLLEDFLRLLTEAVTTSPAPTVATNLREITSIKRMQFELFMTEDKQASKH